MEDVKEAGTCGQMKLFTETIHTTHCEKHGDRRAEGEEVTRPENQLRIPDHRHSSATAADDEIHRRAGRGSQQRITDTKQRISGSTYRADQLINF